MAVTPPPCGLRPERGNWFACVAGAAGGAGCTLPNWEYALTDIPETRKKRTVFRIIIVGIRLAELFTKTPCAERHHYESNRNQSQQWAIKNTYSAALEHDAACND